MKKYYSFVLMFFLSLSIFAQDREADSLKTLIDKGRDDTIKVKNLIALSRVYVRSSPDTALKITTRASRLSKRLNYKRGEALALKFAGNANFIKSNYFEAMNNFDEAMSIFKSINDKAAVAKIQNGNGAIYMNQGEDNKALEYFFSALKTGEEINDSLCMCLSLNNIAVGYQNKRNTWDKARSFYLRSLTIAELINEKDVFAASTTGLGEYYMNRDSVSLDSAVYYTEKSLAANMGTVDEPYTTNLLGQIYQKKKNFDKAISLFKYAYELSVKFESQYDLSISKMRLAQAYKAKGENKLALTTYKEAEATAISSKSNYLLKEIYEDVASVYEKLHDYSNVIKYQNLLIGIKDTIYNNDSDKKIQGTQFTFDRSMKEGQIKMLTKDQKIKEQEIKRLNLTRNGLIGFIVLIMIFAAIYINLRIKRAKMAKEKKRSEELLLNILPQETIDELKNKGKTIAKDFDEVTVMFADFKNFTSISENFTAQELVALINLYYSAFDDIISKNRVEKIKTIGDCYMCAGGLPVESKTNAEDTIKAAVEIKDFMSNENKKRQLLGLPFFDIRIGCHTGPIVAGIVGIKKYAYDIWGDTVNIASRIESNGEAGRVNISGTSYNLVKNKFRCQYRGKIPVKNKGDIDMYFVEEIKHS